MLLYRLCDAVETTLRLGHKAACIGCEVEFVARRGLTRALGLLKR